MSRSGNGAALSEKRAVWHKVSGSWQPLFGGLAEHGLSLEWHDFQITDEIDWSGSFHPGSLELCLNFSGAARIQDGAIHRDLEAGMIAIYTARKNAPSAVRFPGSIHRFLTVEITPEFLRTQTRGHLEGLKEPLRAFVENEGECPHFLEIRPLTTALLSLRTPLLEPPVAATARHAWYSAKTLEILAHTVFREDDPGELFCHRHKRQNSERVQRAQYLLERDLENPPSLEMLAKEVSCSTFHLSRVFAEETGMSIPKFLRTVRIERAAEMLRKGQCSVTDAAMTVGYSSLSAFNKAFVEQMGCCPGLYPVVQIPGRSKKGDAAARKA